MGDSRYCKARDSEPVTEGPHQGQRYTGHYRITYAGPMWACTAGDGNYNEVQGEYPEYYGGVEQ